MENQTFHECKTEKLEKKLIFWRAISRGFIIGLAATLGTTAIERIKDYSSQRQSVQVNSVLVSQNDPEKYNPISSAYPRDNDPHHYIPK